MKALDQPASERDISSLTMGLSREQYKWLKKRVSDFRDDLQQELQNMDDDENTMVAQLNVQLFPVTEE